jgi:alkanesulfonate monooxygenase SsuD/methylene tetrahydromethanopterin reductase-like flavin-dependent oxidoreductase (luciferase family)
MAENPTLQFGVLLPTREAVMSGWRDPAEIYRLAERAEELNFHSVWVGDSLTARPRVEALATLAAVGARTKHVRLGTSIFLAALRQPVLLAYQLASLDWLAGGRVDLGIGYGRPNDAAHEVEYRHVGITAENRIKRSEEIVTVMRRLWRERDVSFEGAFCRLDHVTLEPKPAQANGVPIWLASNEVEPGLKRVARMGDAWINNIKTPEAYRECWEKIQNYAAAAGRDPRAIHPSIYMTVAAGAQSDAQEGMAFLAQYYHRPYDAVANSMLCVTGSWETVIDKIVDYREAGARTVVLRFAARDQTRHLESCAAALNRRGLLSVRRNDP